MKQLSIRGFSEELEVKIKTMAEKEGISLNRAVMKLLEKGAGLSGGKRDDKIGHRLDEFFDNWTEKESREFEDAVSCFEKIDPQLWS